MEKTLRNALNNKSPLQIIYKTAEGIFTKRTILITKVEKDHIRAYCYLRRQFRTFRTDHILAAFPENTSDFTSMFSSGLHV
ncbi:hypothetical protein ACOJQI_06560 [Bacillus salacetis]|uniref:WYL domain-containing protein n=1 Tax=Bacillus salacetis TaxID=2315464 RepID=UPI003B9EED1E